MLFTKYVNKNTDYTSYENLKKNFSISIPENNPAIIVEMIIAKRTLTFFKHKKDNNNIDITAGLNIIDILTYFFFLK